MPAADKHQPPTARWLADRYLVDGLSTEEIAGRCGWSSQYVRDRLRDFGIPLRRPGTPGRIGSNLDRDTLTGWLRDGLSVRQISARSGYTTSGIYRLLRQFRLTVPAPPPPPAANDPVTAELVRLYRHERLSLAVIARRYNHDPDWVKARLRRAGVPLRAPGRRATVDPGRVRALLDEGLRVPEIAATIGCSDTTVLTILRAHGWAGPPRRPRGPNQRQPPAPDEAVLRRLYLDQGLSVHAVADRLGLSPGRVRAALRAARIPVQKPGWVAGQPPPPITADQLQRLYVDQQLTTRQVATALQCSQTRVLAGLRRHHIPLREDRPTAPPLPVDESTLTELYMTQRLDDQAIAARYGVPAWRVTSRRRTLGVHRPAGAPRKSPPTAPDPRVLARLYTDEGHTLHDIARRHHTSTPVVRAWLAAAGVPVKPRTAREHRKHLDPALIAELYQEREWSSAQIAAHQDTTVNQVLRTLHDHGIPVRPGGTPPRRPDNDRVDPRLTALYTDPEITALLRRHRIPRRNRPGTITERFPTEIPITARFLREAYLDIGLATTHIEQLTGQPAEKILNHLRLHAIPVRPPGLSPWLQRQRQHRRKATSPDPRAHRMPSSVAARL